MTVKGQKVVAKAFAEYWKDKSYERREVYYGKKTL